MSDIFDEDDFYSADEVDYEPWQKVCKFCGKDGFEWVETEAGWRLFNMEGIHVCPNYYKKHDLTQTVARSLEGKK